MRKYLSILCIILTLLLLPSALAEENLLRNGDFSDVNGDMPAEWEKGMWLTDMGVSILKVESDGYDGNCISVQNVASNDARFAQTVSVEPNTLYRISCMCMAEGIGEEGAGATISIEDTFCYSASLRDTGGEWVPLELYGRTGDDQTELTVLARVGGYSSESVGQAWFDNFRMEAVESAPEDAVVYDFSSFASNNANSAFTASTVDVEPDRNTEMYVLLACLYLLAVLAAARKYARTPEKQPAFYARCFWGMLALALALRVVLAVRIPGYHTDINCFSAWSDLMASEGPAGFYHAGVWCDYPPGYMWMLGPIGALRAVLGLATRSGGHLLLIKLWPIAFDLLAAGLIWRQARPRLGVRAALMLSAFFAFNPAVFTDSAAWGQIDSVYTLLIALCALRAMDRKYISSMCCFALALLIKPQSLLFAPLGLFAIVADLFRNRSEDRKPMLRALAGVAAALGILYGFALISNFDTSQGLWHCLSQPVVWLWNLYAETTQGYANVTVNALNLYYLLDLNWQETALHPGVTAFAWVCLGVSYVLCMVLYAMAKDRRRLPLIGGLLILLICTFGPMIHERYAFPAILLLALGYIYARDKRVLISMAVLSFTLFLNEVLVLQGGMTEANYGHLQASEDWINYSVSLLNVLNALFAVWTVTDLCIPWPRKVPVLDDDLSDDAPLRTRLVPREYPLEPCEPESESPAARDLFGKHDHRLHLKRLDALLMAAATLIYGVVAFINLGSTQAPQTTWISTEVGEEIVFDLGEVQRFRLTYYGNICNSTFTVELSNDGEVWTEPYYAKYAQGEIFRWLWYVPQNADGTQVAAATTPTEDGSAYVAFAGYEGESYPFQTARYVRLTPTSPGLKLCEVGFLDAEGTALPIESVTHYGADDSFVTEDGLYASDVQRLVDEQDTIPPYPSYYNSSYFDEIYHARTAYEHLHGEDPYEDTHPPLGKVLMMVGVQIFGMTPFGWRFMGALVGVLMVPLMYLLVKQLTHSTRLSFIAMFLLSVDSMHFTQTRIATIDSYSVFWIMLMYLFMFRYLQMHWHSRRDFGRSLIPLGLCGVTMGIAWATKWIGLYASAGLAVLFFWSLYRRFREYRLACAHLKDRNREIAALCSETAQNFWRSLWITIGFCLVFFVAIPVVIYYFSYFWHLRGLNGQNGIYVRTFADMFSLDSVREVANQQLRMLNYHAGLSGDTHFFRSPWYQWPIIWWPMWYYTGTAYLPDSSMISSISCMGNPAVWWFGLVALLFVLVRACIVRRAPKTYLIVLISFASQFLPWVLVPRSTFIYHYFASVPFIIIASVLMLDWIRTKSVAAFKTTALILMAAALILFIAFYPLESGLPVARSYANYLRWFAWINF